MNKTELFSLIRERKSFLCVGLDTDLEKIPAHLRDSEDPFFEFNKQIIDATRDLCVAYKPNLAFYEAAGVKGWQALEKTLRYIGKTHFTIADAKRGDIGNTSKLYAKTFFENLDCDAVTVAPYMGVDSVLPFLDFENKWVILLALTSNEGSRDFQFLEMEKERLFEKVLKTARQWADAERMMFVVGATHPEMFAKVRAIVPDHFLLVPGIGAQGGELAEVAKFGLNYQCGLLVNSSRGIIYAGNGTDFAGKARAEAQKIQSEMAEILAQKFNI